MWPSCENLHVGEGHLTSHWRSPQPVLGHRGILWPKTLCKEESLAQQWDVQCEVADDDVVHGTTKNVRETITVSCQTEFQITVSNVQDTRPRSLRHSDSRRGSYCEQTVLKRSEGRRPVGHRMDKITRGTLVTGRNIWNFLIRNQDPFRLLC